MVIDLSRLRGRAVRERARDGGGGRAADRHAALPHLARGVRAVGSCPSVGVAGLTLGGGHGLAGRRFGLTTDNLRAATIVTADGQVRQVAPNRNEDLYWACRGGGGGNFGIVTSFTFQTHRAPGAAWFLISLAVGAGRRGAGGLAALRARRPGGAHLDLLARHHGRRRPAARIRARAVLRLGRRAAQPDPAARARGRRQRERGQLELLLARAALGRLPRRGLPRLPHARNEPGRRDAARLLLRQVRLLRRAAAGARAKDDDRLGGAPPAQPLAGLGRAAPRRLRGAYNRPAADATAFVHRDMLFSLQYGAYFTGSGPGVEQLDQRRLARPAAVRVGPGLPELHRPAAHHLAAGLLRRRTCSACARSRSRSTPSSASASSRRFRPRVVSGGGPRFAPAPAGPARLPCASSQPPRSRGSPTRCSRSAWCCSCSIAPAAPGWPARRWPRSRSQPADGPAAWRLARPHRPPARADGGRPARDRGRAASRSSR